MFFIFVFMGGVEGFCFMGGVVGVVWFSRVVREVRVCLNWCFWFGVVFGGNSNLIEDFLVKEKNLWVKSLFDILSK